MSIERVLENHKGQPLDQIIDLFWGDFLRQSLKSVKRKFYDHPFIPPPDNNKNDVGLEKMVYHLLSISLSYLVLLSKLLELFSSLTFNVIIIMLLSRWDGKSVNSYSISSKFPIL